MDLSFTQKELSRAEKIVRRYDRDKKVGRWSHWILFALSLMFVVLAFVTLKRSQDTLELIEKREQPEVYEQLTGPEFVVVQDQLNRSYIKDYLTSFVLLAMYGFHLLVGIVVWKRYRLEPIDVKVYRKILEQKNKNEGTDQVHNNCFNGTS